MNTEIKQIQKILGVKPDGIWGPKSQGALNLEIERTVDANDKIERIQKILEVKVDGQWGVKTQTAFNILKGDGDFRITTMSSFADVADVAAFQKCKTTGKSDVQCFKVGDNGVGCFGKVTAQTTIPMVAIHNDDMVAQWGSQAGAAHRIVELEINGIVLEAACEDRISARKRVDCNPAIQKRIKQQPPFLIKGKWRWKL